MKLRFPAWIDATLRELSKYTSGHFSWYSIKKHKGIITKNPIHIISYTVIIILSQFLNLPSFLCGTSYRLLFAGWGGYLGCLGYVGFCTSPCGWQSQHLCLQRPTRHRCHSGTPWKNSEMKKGKVDIFLHWLSYMIIFVCINMYMYVPLVKKNTKPTWYVNFVCYYMYGIKMN